MSDQYIVLDSTLSLVIGVAVTWFGNRLGGRFKSPDWTMWDGNSRDITLPSTPTAEVPLIKAPRALPALHHLYTFACL